MSFSVSFFKRTHSCEFPTPPLSPVSACHYGRGHIGVLFPFLSVLTFLRFRLLEEVLILMLKAPDTSPGKLKVELQKSGWLICEVFLPLRVQPVAEKNGEAEPPRNPVNNSSAPVAAGDKALTVCCCLSGIIR